MALAIGKRKRREDVSNNAIKNEGDSDDDAAARALFQRAFEKKFKPLEKDEKPVQQKSQNSDDEDEDEDDDDNDSGSESSNSDEDEDENEDFSGFSASEDEQENATKPQIEVIEDRAIRKTNPAEEKRLKKQFMSSKIPSTSTTPQYPIPKKVSATATPTEDDTEDNLQNDLALQRLLKESHLLDPTTFSSSGTASSAPEGAARLRALDMRIRDLGGKKSHMDQERMPIAFRKGMVAKASEKEGKRRTEAKENGIILERFGAKSGAGNGGGSGSRGGGAGGGKDRKRAIGTGGPDIGTFRGATLRLSKNDIKGIEGSGKRGGKGGRGGRGGKKKGGMNFGSGF